MAEEVIYIAGGENATRRFQRILTVMGKQLMDEVGMFIMTRIKTRTAKGVDVEGSFFQPYHPKYAFFRHKHGRPVDKVDLLFTGSMLSAMTEEGTPSSVHVFFMPTTDRKGMSNPAKAYYLNASRRFFAMSDQDRKDISTLVLDSLNKAMR
jgi:hypothetical protein